MKPLIGKMTLTFAVFRSCCLFWDKASVRWRSCSGSRLSLCRFHSVSGGTERSEVHRSHS